jgi:hypothetical protein
MPQVDVVELPNSHMVVEIDLDEILLILGVDFAVLHSLAAKVSPFHVIFLFEQSFDYEMFQ